MLIMRHPVTVRLWHWLTAAAVVSLIYTGFIIFNIHPRLYWGEVGNARMPAIFAIESPTNPPDTKTRPSPAVLRIGSSTIDVTGVLGFASLNGEYFLIMRAIDLPIVIKFGASRAWHFAWAWVLVLSWMAYVVYLVASGKLKRDFLPTAEQLKPRAIWQDIWDHLRLRRARGEEAARYNLLQKLAYLFVVFILIPLMLVSGLTMSNAITAAFPELFTLFGGRQSARTVHAICAALFILFVLVHIFQLFVAGFINHVRSMITGRLAVSERT